MSDIKECRSYDFEVRADQSEEHGHFVTGRAIVFNQSYDNGWFTEIIEPEALNDTDMKDVRLLVNHNTDMIPLARSRNNNANSTMQLSVVPGEGLDIRADLDVERNGTAMELYSAADRGDLTGMSFMFTVNGERWEGLDTERPTRYITEIRKIFEVSAVTWPAYEQTTFEARQADAGALESAQAVLESARSEVEANERTKRIRELTERLNRIKEA